MLAALGARTSAEEQPEFSSRIASLRSCQDAQTPQGGAKAPVACAQGALPGASPHSLAEGEAGLVMRQALQRANDPCRPRTRVRAAWNGLIHAQEIAGEGKTRMGMLGRTMLFPKGAPAKEAIREAVGRRTGLLIKIVDSDEFPITERTGALFNAEFRFPINFSIEEDKVVILAALAAQSYLFFCTLASLEDLGGRPEDPRTRPLPDFVNRKWSERKWWQRWRG